MADASRIHDPQPGDRPLRPAAGTAGITLVELLVVMAIVALLAGLSLPVLGVVRACAKQTVCAGAQRQIHLACTLYANDQDGQLPDICLAGSTYWQILIKDQLEQSRATYQQSAYAQGNIFQACPELERSATGCGYSLNSKLAFGEGGQRDLVHNRWIQGGTWTTFTLAGVSRPSQRLYLGDSAAPAVPGGAMVNYLNADSLAADLQRMLRHRGRQMAVFIDGHGGALAQDRQLAGLRAAE